MFLGLMLKRMAGTIWQRQWNTWIYIGRALICIHGRRHDSFSIFLLSIDMSCFLDPCAND